MYYLRTLSRLFSTVPVFAMLLGCSGSALMHAEQGSESGNVNYLTDYSTFVKDCTINVVVEIPAGTTAKWELKHDGTEFQWDVENGKPRVVQYSPYPGNYGMVPRTLLPLEAGGDGDPLDVIVLSDTVPRGSVISANPVAVLGLTDNSEMDDKIIAVAVDGALSDVTSLAALNQSYPGIPRLLEIWFTGYKGGETESRGYSDEGAACNLIMRASRYFEREHASGGVNKR